MPSPISEGTLLFLSTLPSWGGGGCLEEMALSGGGLSYVERGTEVFGRGHRNVGGGVEQMSYVFRRQRIGGATEWYLGAQNYPLGSGIWGT